MAIGSHSGGCHCGRIRFNVQADLADVLECNCSICVKKGILHVIVPKAAFELLSGQDDLVVYQFNTNVAKHLFCGVCGIHSFYVPRSHPDKIDVNVRCFDDVDLANIVARPFDGKHWEDAMQRHSEQRHSSSSR